MFQSPKWWKLALSLIGFWLLSNLVIAVFSEVINEQLIPNPWTPTFEQWLKYVFSIAFVLSVVPLIFLYLPIAAILLIILGRKLIFLTASSGPRNVWKRLTIAIAIWLVAGLGLFLAVTELSDFHLASGFEIYPPLSLVSELGAILLTVTLNKAKHAN
jgi:hypothetical protein